MEQFEELDIRKLFKVVIQNISFIIACTLIVGIIAFVYSETMVIPSYRSSVMMYVNNNNRSTMLSKSQTSGADMQASQMLVNTYITIIRSDTVMNEVSSELERRYGLQYSSKEILRMLSAGSVDETEIFKVFITGNNPEHTALIANVISDVSPEVISNFVEASSVKVIDSAAYGVRVAPSVSKNTIIGFLLGLLYSCAYIILRECFDTRVKSEVDLERWFHKSILGIIPEIGENDNNEARYYYYRRSYKYRTLYGKNGVKGGYPYGKQYYDEFIEASKNVTKGASKKA